jgi:hypothetical protein
MAYGRIAKNKGAMTPGVNDETADGMSLDKIDISSTYCVMNGMDGCPSDGPTFPNVESVVRLTWSKTGSRVIRPLELYGAVRPRRFPPNAVAQYAQSTTSGENIVVHRRHRCVLTTILVGHPGES